jgi:predicted deacylase
MQRLGKNVGKYLGEGIDIRQMLGEMELAAAAHGWRAEVFHQTREFKWLALRRSAISRTTQPATRLYLSTGIHGDEPAGPLAVLQLLRDNLWPASADLWLCPCLNPTGFTLNTRENAAGLDLNRQYLNPEADEVRAHIAWLARQPDFDICLCLHEDWESQGFYLYELNPDNQPSFAEAIISHVAKICPIDLSPMIEERPAVNGIIRPSTDPTLRPKWPEAFYLFNYKTRLSYTVEAPSDFPIATRVAAAVAAVRTVLELIGARHD